MVDRLVSFLKQILKRNVTMVNNGVGSMCATVAEASIWMHLTNCPNVCSWTDFLKYIGGGLKGWSDLSLCCKMRVWRRINIFSVWWMRKVHWPVSPLRKSKMCESSGAGWQKTSVSLRDSVSAFSCKEAACQRRWLAVGSERKLERERIV